MQSANKSNPEQPETPKRKKMALGRGLDALIPDLKGYEEKSEDFFQCDIDLIRPNRYQPRRHFSESELLQLSESIKSQGIIQPLVVRKAEFGFELVAGERRLRASKLAGLKRVPVLLKDIGDTEMLEMSIVENIQRENLNPLEESDAYHRLITEFDLTQEEAASRVGKSRSAVANFLRLRHLPERIKESIREGLLSMGHARALLGADTPAQMKTAWQTVIARKLSVRETEDLVKRLKKRDLEQDRKVSDSDTIHFKNLAEELSRSLGTKVSIKRRGKRGRLELEFYTNEDLDRLIEALKRM